MRPLLRLSRLAALPCILVAGCIIEAPTFVDFSDGGSIDANELTPGDLELVSGSALDFETVEIESTSSTTQSVTVRNIGAVATVALEVSLADETNYAIVTDTCAGVALEPDASCSVELRFNPTIVGALPTQVSVRDSPTTGIIAQVDGSGSARVQVDMTGTGMVVSLPAGIACGSGCPSATSSFVESPVTLSATDLAGFTFDGWSGACASAGLARDCTVTLGAALTSVGASFRALACIPDSIDCNDTTDHYIDCSPTGTVEVEMDCPLGCSTTSEQCVDVNPSNGLATYLDMAPTGPDVAFTGSSTINTTNGVVFIGGTSITVPHTLVGTTRVFMFNSLSIAGTLKVTGDTLALVVDGDVTITGLLDVSADGLTRGPGGRDPTSAGSSGTCDGSSRYTGSSNPSPGGGGAGGFSSGAIGGAAGDGTTTSGGGLTTGAASAIPLRGGCAGGFTVEDPPTRISHGGAGGGGVQIVSRTGISVTGSGKIDASGGGGQSRSVGTSTTAAIGGGGGGAGGAILLEAPQVSLDGAAVVLSTKGGGGAAAGVGSAGHHGADGGTGAAAASGGTNGALAGGGAGATETLAPIAGSAGTGSNDGGGGGGRVGTAVFKNSGGAVIPQNGAVIRSVTGATFIATRLVP